jgi:hypothetical protein
MSLRQQLDFDLSEQLCERHDASDFGTFSA